MKIIMLGAPGAGKGTQAKKIAAKYEIPHISTGDIFRANIKNGTELGKKAKTYMDQGALDVALAKLNDKIDYAINVEVPDDNIINRMGGRRACVGCGATYHVVFNAPKLEDTCDSCGEKLILRDDDKPETVKKRLDVYHEQTQPLIDYYKKAGALREVDGPVDMEDVFQAIVKVLGE